MDFKKHIRTIQDFPKPGIEFYDISTLLAHGEAWKNAINELTKIIAPLKPDLLAAIESRGFLIAAPLAYQLNCGFVMMRKKGKLPGKTTSYTYDLEYGTDTMEIQSDLIQEHQRIVLVDDLLATGGTLQAAIHLLEAMNAQICAAATIIELSALKGRDKIKVPFTSLISYP
ncbi:MAG: adenine phosphoribosyltransferase [Alphaproteobacteria bacterium]|nr:adenine phosphoribosyltransferase [Alphaproteobacteria bacterium]MDP3532996.1 adenine phosphoribosyltransferase [Alphaproteobacteria bacterium]